MLWLGSPVSASAQELLSRAGSTAAAPRLRPSQIWWALFSRRLLELRAGFPPTLQGTIQFCVGSSPEPPTFFYIALKGGHSSVHEGLGPEPDVWVELDEPKLAALLWSEDEEATAGALRSYGRSELLVSLLTKMGQHGRPQSLLSLRSMR